VGENDDVGDGCFQSKIEVAGVRAGTYCFMMGCYADSACIYTGKVIVEPPKETDLIVIYPPQIDVSNTRSAFNANTASVCFDVPYSNALITVQTYDEVCGDTTVSGDSYIRLRRDNITGVKVGENDDVGDGCFQSKIEAAGMRAGTYCFMMGCYADSPCMYTGKVIVERRPGTASAELISSPHSARSKRSDDDIYSQTGSIGAIAVYLTAVGLLVVAVYVGRCWWLGQPVGPCCAGAKPMDAWGDKGAVGMMGEQSAGDGHHVMEETEIHVHSSSIDTMDA
jgi:hypothetical protein